MLTEYTLITDIWLISNDAELVHLLREIALEILGPGVSVRAGLIRQGFPGDSLCIWDFVPGETMLPDDRHDDRRLHLFLLHRKDLSLFRSLMGCQDLNILLKPITEAAVRAFLSGYRLQNDVSCDVPSSVDAIRGDRDEMLQILMQANLKLQEFTQERSNFLGRSIHDCRA